MSASDHKALVTGGTGFIGQHLVARLLADGAAATALVRSCSILPAEWQGKVTVVCCDDWSEQGVRAALDGYGFDAVFHLAAYGVRPDDRDVGRMVQINVDLPAVLARLCSEWGARFVMAGTFSEYIKPLSNDPLTEGSRLEPFKLYGSTKAAGGLVASCVAQELGVGLRLLRLFKVYGAGEAPHRLLPALVSGLSRKQRVAISSGTQILDFVYVDDVIESLVRAESHIRARGDVTTWNVATGQGHSVRDFARMVAAVMEVDHDLLGFGEISMRKDDEPWLVGDPRLMREELGWSPQTDLHIGIKAAIAAISRETH
ncbi:NAD-dependent epimerase/dehydratase family protein [Nitrobacter sp. JJSN]|uniref:NAD-dependent epimerase/dehydratase family protein n=1 Tax=Nitrobacter sp. JJSN TaxID=3453033 RepID=UPI003F764A6C